MRACPQHLTPRPNPLLSQRFSLDLQRTAGGSGERPDRPVSPQITSAVAEVVADEGEDGGLLPDLA